MNTDKRYNRKSRLRGIGVVSVLLMGTALSACSGDNVLSEFGFGQDSDSAAQDALGVKIPYEVQIEGIDPQEEKLLAALRDVSTSIRLQSRPTPSLAGLERRAEDDVERFETVLRSFGFYDGQVSFNIRKTEHDDQNTPDGENGGEGDDIVSAASEPAAGAPDSAEQPDPVDLVYQIDVNQPYLLSEVKLVIVRPDHTTRREATDEELERTNLHLGQRAAADRLPN